MTEPKTPWWATFDLPEGTVGRWVIGPMTLTVAHGPGEWQIAHEEASDPLSVDTAIEVPFDPAPPQTDAPQPAPSPDLGDASVRFASRAPATALTLTPALADRPMVARPLRPLLVLPGDEATLLVSSTVWLQVTWPGQATPLLDVPLTRPTDTWFGPNRVEGELCYATRTRALLRLDELPLRPGRAVSALHLHNKGPEPLRVERAKLPVDRLALHVGDDGRLWTDALRIVTAGVHSEADVQRESGPPAMAGPCTQLATPRRLGGLQAWKRALNGLLG